MKTLLKYRKDYYSQNGEDGVIEEILRRMGIKQGWFVDVGAWDGKYLSNSFALVEKGWKGLEIKGDKTKFEDILKIIVDYNMNQNLKGGISMDSELRTFT